MRLLEAHDGATSKRAPRPPPCEEPPPHEEATTRRKERTRSEERSKAASSTSTRRPPPPPPRRGLGRDDERNDSMKKDGKDDRKKDRDDEKDSKKKDDKDDRKKGDMKEKRKKTDKKKKDDGKRVEDDRKKDKAAPSVKKGGDDRKKVEDDRKKDKPIALATHSVKKGGSFVEDLAAMMHKKGKELTHMLNVMTETETQRDRIDAQIQTLEEEVAERNTKMMALRLSRTECLAEIEEQGCAVEKKKNELMETTELHAKYMEENQGAPESPCGSSYSSEYEYSSSGEESAMTKTGCPLKK